jgi:seryl-tRNA synthetase
MTFFSSEGGGDEFQFLLPTAETALTNLHADEILIGRGAAEEVFRLYAVLSA